MAAARALHVVRVDGPAGDRGDGVLELGDLVEPVGVEADRDVARFGERQRRVDQLRVGAVVLVDLEADRAGLEQQLQVRRVLDRALAWSPMFTGHPSSPRSVRSIAHGGSSKPAVISVVTPPRQRGGDQVAG